MVWNEPKNILYSQSQQSRASLYRVTGAWPTSTKSHFDFESFDKQLLKFRELQDLKNTMVQGFWQRRGCVGLHQSTHI